MTTTSIKSKEISLLSSTQSIGVDGDNSEILCCGFSIRLEFEEEWKVGFSGLGGWVFNLIFEFEIGF